MSQKNLIYFFFILIFSFSIFLMFNGFFILKNYNLEISKLKKIENNNQSINIIPKTNLEKKIYKNKKLKELKELKELLPIMDIIIVKKNDTFSKIIKPYIKNDNYRAKIINAINKKFNLKNLRINQKIIVFFDNNKITKKIVIPINFYTELITELDGKKINTYENKIQFIKENISMEFKINSSLYEDGKNAGLPLNILSNVIKLYSFDLDFQRDIKKDTIFQISYEKLLNQERNEISFGKIEYINLIIDNKKIEYFIFKTNDGFYDYFNDQGKNIKKSLLKTPIDGAKLSSSFGMRKHPISGFNKLHKGVDFAAPKGTPVFAGGNGVIEYMGQNGGYGNYLRIRHSNQYKTAYAHLSKFKKGISIGKRVNQGEIIAYVGNTGKSTGPHLHYEILYKNKQINPMTMKLPSGKVLKEEELKKFKKEAKSIYSNFLFNLYE